MRDNLTNSRSAFGNASHFFVASVQEVSIESQRRTGVATPPIILQKRESLVLKLRFQQVIYPKAMPPETYMKITPAQWRKEGQTQFNATDFLRKIGNGDQLFYAKLSLVLPSDPYLYPSDLDYPCDNVERVPIVNSWITERMRNTSPQIPIPGYYRVPGRTYHVQQDERNACWAAVSAMLLSWREQKQYSVEDVVRFTGISRGKLSQGLPREMMPKLMEILRLRAEPPSSFTARGVHDLLQEHGPLWVTINRDYVQTTTPILEGVETHARLIIATRGKMKLSDDPQQFVITYMDPLEKKMEITQNLTEFTKSLEQIAQLDLEAARSRSADHLVPPRVQPFQYQITHF